MNEELDEYPSAFADSEIYPWERPESPSVWPWGNDRGKPLRECSSTDLLRKRREIERKNGKGSYFAPLLDAIDAVLTERQGL